MKQLKEVKSPPTEGLIPIEQVAEHWEVTPKTIEKWTEVVYMAFDVHLPKSGPFPEWGVQLLDLCGKHISQKATLYFAETQESRRLKGVEFVRKIRRLRQDGHFQEFQKFQKFQKSQLEQSEEEDAENELETLSELAAIARQQDEQLHTAQQLFEQREDEQIEQLATFIEDSDRRKMRKLSRRLKFRRDDTQTQQVIDVSFSKELPG